MRLGPKIFLVSALAIVALSSSIGWSLLTVKRLVSVNQDIATRSVPALRLQGELRETLHALVRLETRALVLGDLEYARAWRERAARMAEGLDELGRHVETEEERAGLAATRAAFDDYRAHVEEESRLLAAGHPRAALRLAEGRTRDTTQRVETALAAGTVATEAALARSQAHARALEEWTWHAVAAALLTSLALAVAASGFLAFRMTRSLRRLSAATAALAAGTWTGSLATPDRDEIGELGRSFDHMAERLRQVDKLKQEFFSHVSHDLRNPLASIRLAAETLQERARKASDPRGLRLAQLIEASAGRMLAMVNQILDFTRLQALAVPLETRPIDALEAVTRAMDELRPVAEAKRIRLTLAAEGTDFTVLGEEGSLVRVVVNLLGNAVNFTGPDGAVTLRLAEFADRLELQVRDTGVGIPSDALSAIFEPYRQAHGRRQGTGLGLAVVKGLVEAHHGTVSVASAPGEGSCFTIELPKAPPAAA
ncbi:MAG TPA: ATP-binding protein [Verrucomicrobiae bacterium]|jgi:signal transduction histidine kinase|nr:ATP-binding protein [Verrucomicrobiae bacterium]